MLINFSGLRIQMAQTTKIIDTYFSSFSAGRVYRANREKKSNFNKRVREGSRSSAF